MSIRVFGSATSPQSEIQFTISDYVHDGVVSVVGNFNDWTPGMDVFVLHREGTRVALVTVSGLSEVRFRYLGSEGVWFDDADADEIDDQGCLLRLPPSPSREPPGDDVAEDLPPTSTRAPLPHSRPTRDLTPLGRMPVDILIPTPPISGGSCTAWRATWTTTPGCHPDAPASAARPRRLWLQASIPALRQHSSCCRGVAHVAQ